MSMQFYLGWFCGALVGMVFFMSKEWLIDNGDPKPAQTAFLYACGAAVVVGLVSGVVRALA